MIFNANLVKESVAPLLPLSKYIEIKNNYCLGYYGPLNEYVLLLRYFKPIIEQTLNVNLILSFKDSLNTSDEINQTDTQKFLYDKYIGFEEIKLDLKTHPILNILKEANIPIAPIPFNNIDTKKCVIITKGIYPPTKQLTDLQVQKISQCVQNKGYSVEINTDITNAGLIVGVESESFCKAVLQGYKAVLIPTGLGTELYEKLLGKKETLQYIFEA